MRKKISELKKGWVIRLASGERKNHHPDDHARADCRASSALTDEYGPRIDLRPDNLFVVEESFLEEIEDRDSDSILMIWHCRARHLIDGAYDPSGRVIFLCQTLHPKLAQDEAEVIGRVDFRKAVLQEGDPDI